MPKTTHYHIEPSTTRGWFNIVSKATGATVAHVCGYAAAMADCRRLNKSREQAALEGKAA